MPSFRPSYIALNESGELSRRSSVLRKMLSPCSLCPRRCAADRKAGDLGVCGLGPDAVVSSHGPHFGEEPPLVGPGGSGTTFMTKCNMGCLFCQNHEISQEGKGSELSTDELASVMLDLQRRGCSNINFVTPTHQISAIVEAVARAADLGLELPLVYNSSGYDSVETIRLLDGVFDIYMPDFKYSDDSAAFRFSRALGYVDAAAASIKEMHRQVGVLKTDARGLAYRGLIVRHLVLPGDLAGTREIMRFIARELSPDTYVNLMDQYRPCYRAGDEPEIARRITAGEFEEAVKTALEEGLTRLEGVNA